MEAFETRVLGLKKILVTLFLASGVTAVVNHFYLYLWVVVVILKVSRYVCSEN